MMGSSGSGDGFKREAVAQITERGCPVRAASGRLGVGPYSLCAWKKTFAEASTSGSGKDTGIRRPKREPVRMSQERDIPKKGGACPVARRGAIGSGAMGNDLEPLRVCRRLISVGCAAVLSVSGAAVKSGSAAAGGMFPIGSRRRRVSNRSTHSRVAYPTAWEIAPWPAAVDDPCLEGTVDCFRQGVVTAVTDAAGGGRVARLAQPLGVSDGQVLRPLGRNGGRAPRP